MGGGGERHFDGEQVDRAASHEYQRACAQDGGHGLGCPTQAAIPVGTPVLACNAGHPLRTGMSAPTSPSKAYSIEGE